MNTVIDNKMDSPVYIILNKISQMAKDKQYMIHSYVIKIIVNKHKLP